MSNHDLVWAGTILLAVGMICLTALRMWHGWLELKRLELTTAQAAGMRSAGGVGEMIEVADLKERIRKLESIAACVDL